MNNKENSPFTPGSPVPVELFVGRLEQIEELIKYIKQASFGKQENIFLAGDRGVGKSSLASFLRYFVSDKENILGIHVFLGRVNTLEEMVRHIFDQLLKESKKQTWFGDISKLFGDHIKEIGLFGVSVSFTPSNQDLKELVMDFPAAINNFFEEIKEKKAGLFIALDDVNGLVENTEFANWYKSFVDEVATHYKYFPVFIMLIGLPEKRGILSNLQPSLMRVFRVIEIKKLSDEEVREFISQAFKKVNIKVETEAMKIMVRFSSGVPLLMHEIGDATFWIDVDEIINKKDAIQGILRAAENAGQKYLVPKVYESIRSPLYRSILRKLGKGEVPPPRNFKKKDVEAQLNAREKKVFPDFLRRMKKLEVIEADIEGGIGAYKFVNEIYPIYIWMESWKSIRG